MARGVGSPDSSVGMFQQRQQLTFLGSDDERLRGPTHQPAVPIYQVSHILGNGQGRRRHCQRLERAKTKKEPLLFCPIIKGAAAL